MRWLPLLLLALAVSACSRHPTYGPPPPRDSTPADDPHHRLKCGFRRTNETVNQSPDWERWHAARPASRGSGRACRPTGCGCSAGTRRA
jgi:hypothetical protein